MTVFKEHVQMRHFCEANVARQTVQFHHSTEIGLLEGLSAVAYIGPADACTCTQTVPFLSGHLSHAWPRDGHTMRERQLLPHKA